jgi:hypothetical protein
MRASNDPATDRKRLRFMNDTMSVNEWAIEQPNVSVKLGYRIGFDRSLRMSLTDGKQTFFPVMDGIAGVDYKDFNDYTIILGSLASSLISAWP